MNIALMYGIFVPDWRNTGLMPVFLEAGLSFCSGSMLFGIVQTSSIENLVELLTKFSIELFESGFLPGFWTGSVPSNFSHLSFC